MTPEKWRKTIGQCRGAVNVPGEFAGSSGFPRGAAGTCGFPIQARAVDETSARRDVTLAISRDFRNKGWRAMGLSGGPAGRSINAKAGRQ